MQKKFLWIPQCLQKFILSHRVSEIPPHQSLEPELQLFLECKHHRHLQHCFPEGLPSLQATLPWALHTHNKRTSVPESPPHIHLHFLSFKHPRTLQHPHSENTKSASLSLKTTLKSFRLLMLYQHTDSALWRTWELSSCTTFQASIHETILLLCKVYKFSEAWQNHNLSVLTKTGYGATTPGLDAAPQLICSLPGARMKSWEHVDYTQHLPLLSPVYCGFICLYTSS